MKDKMYVSRQIMMAMVAAVAIIGAVALPQTAQATAVGDVSSFQRHGMQQLYGYDAIAPGKPGTPLQAPYTVDNSASVAAGSFSRVAYYVELGDGTNPSAFAWVSMDTFNASPLLVGVPKPGSGIVENGTVVNNLVIETNHPNVTAGKADSGIIEFWSSNYSPNGGGLFGSNNGLFDWKDSGGNDGNGHGSFQVFAFTDANQNNANTIFGLTANGGSGLGDQPTGHPDWTFGPHYQTYAVRSVEVWVGNIIPEPTTAVLGLMGLAGLVARRRRAA